MEENEGRGKHWEDVRKEKTSKVETEKYKRSRPGRQAERVVLEDVCQTGIVVVID